MMRQLDDLLDANDPAWPLVLEWIRDAKVPVEVLPPDEAARGPALLAVQVTTRSPMGAVLYESGGILVDSGWLRVLGSGHARLPRSIPAWSDACFGRPGGVNPALLVADDILGGFFALNGGGLNGPPGSVNYFNPGCLEWEDMEVSYSQLLASSLSGALDQFYDGLRWSGWRGEVQEVPGARAFSIMPPLWAEGPSLGERSRRAVPVHELWSVQQDIRRQLGTGAGRTTRC